MKTTVAICLFALISVAVCETYPDRYDHVNVEEIMTNKQLYSAYIKCILHNTHCTPDGKELTVHLKEAMETDCAKCTETQRKKAHIVIIHLVRNKHDDWLQVCQKYDTTGTQCPKYEQKYKN